MNHHRILMVVGVLAAVLDCVATILDSLDEARLLQSCSSSDIKTEMAR